MDEYDLRRTLHPKRMFQRGGRVETCCCCGYEWNVSPNANWPYGYICPTCSRAIKRGGR